MGGKDLHSTRHRETLGPGYMKSLKKPMVVFFFLMNDKLSIFFQKDLSIFASRIKNATI